MVVDAIDLDEEAPESEKKKRKLPKLSVKWIGIGLAALVALVAAGGAAWYFLGYDSAGPDSGEFAEEGAPEVIEIPYDFEEIFTLETFKEISIRGPGKVKLLNVKMELEMEENSLRDELSLSAPRIREMVIPILKARTLDEVRGVDGKILLKNQLIKAINRSLTSGRIRNIYFTEFVVYFES